MADLEKFMEEILEEIKAEERKEEEKHKKIIAKGCPHMNKVEHIGIFTKEKFLVCSVCHKHFWMDGTEVALKE